MLVANPGSQGGQMGGGGRGLVDPGSVPVGHGALANNANLGGWQGLSGILNFLSQGNIGAQAYANLGAGATGRGGYSVGGAHGLFSGLSPYAAQWIQQTLMQKNPAVMDSLTAPDVTNADGTVTHGAALTGHELLMAQLHNSLAALAPATYGINNTYKDATAKDLIDTITGMHGQVAGHNFFAHGYDANGRIIKPKGGRGSR